jgi:anthranilate/para-aminobenzoate synthase component II
VADDGEVQAMHHRELPLWGVQFHPESLFSEHGKVLLDNFLSL